MSAVLDFAPWSEFYTLHPVLVHFPVVLLPVGFLLMAAGWAFHQKALEWAAATVLTTAFVTGLLASKVFHPHPDMTLLATEVLEAHEFWADWTLALALPAAVLTVLRAWGRPARFRTVAATLALLLAAAATVAVAAAAHHGATLTHVHRVGE